MPVALNAWLPMIVWIPAASARRLVPRFLLASAETPLFDLSGAGRSLASSSKQMGWSSARRPHQIADFIVGTSLNAGGMVELNDHELSDLVEAPHVKSAWVPLATDTALAGAITEL